MKGLVPTILLATGFLIDISFLPTALVAEDAGNGYVVEQAASHPCGSTIAVEEGKYGILENQRTNGTYPRDFSCSWTLRAGRGQRILLASRDFAVEMSDDCIWDYLEVRDGEDTASAAVGRFCDYQPLAYISETNKLYLHFTTDGDYQDFGFIFNFSAHAVANEDSACNTFVGSRKPGYVTSPNYPQNYEPDSDCYYRVQAPSGMVVTFNVPDLDMASYDFDKVAVYDGNNSRESLIWSSCDKDNRDKPLRSTGRDLFVHFQSRYYKTKRGFNMTYDFVLNDFTTPAPPKTTPSPIGGDSDCSGIRIVEGNGTISSPMFPDLYPNEKHCKWLLQSSDPDLRVELKFESFSLEQSENCTFDYLRIFWDGSTDVEVSNKFCFDELRGKSVISRDANIRLEFVSDETIGLEGFRVNYHPFKTKSLDCDPQCASDEVCVTDAGDTFCVIGRLCDTNICLNGGVCVADDTFPTCYCSSGFGGDSCETVISTEPIHFLHLAPYKSVAIQEGGSYVLDCGIEDPGVPFNLMWLFDGRMLEGGEGTDITAYPGGILQIDKFNEAFEGNYTCLATTEHRSAEALVHLYFVQACGLHMEQVPTDKVVKTGKIVLMECYVPRAVEQSWSKEGSDGSQQQVVPNDRISVMSNGFLKITDAQTEDSGRYTCSAESEFGCHVTRSARLQVIESVDFKKECGKDKTRGVTTKISSGQTAKPGSTPWHVIFRNKTQGGNFKTFCGGSLISDKWIVTAAHCIAQFGAEFTNNNVELFLGTDKCRGEEGKEHRFARYIIHDNFNRLSFMDSDIALIELEEAVAFTDKISAICIEPYDYISELFFKSYRNGAKKFGRVVGCGKTRDKKGSRDLKEVYVPYVNDDLCTVTARSRGKEYTQTMICAGYRHANSGDACRGDSGGSLTMDVNIDGVKHWVLTGIVSWGVGCDEEGQYGFYNNVGKFYEWIKLTTQLYN